MAEELLIRDINMAKDGGSLSISTNQGYFWVDKEIGTSRPFMITKQGVQVDKQTKLNLIKALNKFPNPPRFLPAYINSIEKSGFNLK